MPPLPSRYNSRGVLHSYFFYRVGAGPFAATPERPLCRRGGRTVSGVELDDERFQRPVWDFDRAFAGPAGDFIAGYYPSHSSVAAPRGLSDPFVQYDIPAMLALGSGWPSRCWEDLIPMTTETGTGAPFRFSGRYEQSCGRHSAEYVGELAAADYEQCLSKVAAKVYAGPFFQQPYPIMKLNGRKNVPKKNDLGELLDVRWCMNHSSPHDSGVNASAVVPHQVFIPITTASRMAGVCAEVCELFVDPSMIIEDWKDAYQSIGIHPRDFWLNGFRVWSPEHNQFVYFVSKVMNFGGVGSGNAFGRVALFVIWQLSVCGFSSELCVDDVTVLGSAKQVTVAQHLLHMLAELLNFSWKAAKRITATSVATYNGFVWDLISRQMRLTPQFLAKIVHVIDKFEWLSRSRQRRDVVESMIGLLARACMAIYMGRFFMFYIRQALRNPAHGDWVSICPLVREEISFFRFLVPKWNGLRSFPPPQALRPTMSVGQCDACKVGLGGVWFEGDKCFWFYHAFTSVRSFGWENCTRECLAMATFLRLYSSSHPATKVYLLQSDNLATVETWNAKRPGTGEGLLHGLRAAASVATIFDIDVLLAHLEGELNVFADAVSRANWPEFFRLTERFSRIRVPIPQAWESAWL